MICMSDTTQACPTCGIENRAPELFEAPACTTCEACGWEICWERWSRTVRLNTKEAWRVRFDDDANDPLTEEIVLTKPELVALRVYETQVSTEPMF